jgi:hypothetical protein
MKNLLFFMLLICSSAFATDYNYGQCPVAVNCGFSSLPVNESTFSDTMTFDLGNWGPDTLGTYVYTSSTLVTVTGRSGITPCAGRGCHGQAYSIVIDSATIDGIPMIPPAPGSLQWSYPASLSPGIHVIAVVGHATGALWYARWAGGVHGIVYSLVPNPPSSND